VPGDGRTTRARAGRGGGGEVWLDTYTAAEANGLNCVFICFVEEPGGEPVFALLDAGAGHDLASWRDVGARADRVSTADELGEVPEAWRGIAVRAGGLTLRPPRSSGPTPGRRTR